MSIPAPEAAITIRQPPAASQATAAAANAALVRVPIPPGARRMPPVNRTQKTEFLGVPVWHAPSGSSHADWPIVDTYARLVWRGDDELAVETDSEA